MISKSTPLRTRKALVTLVMYGFDAVAMILLVYLQSFFQALPFIIAGVIVTAVCTIKIKQYDKYKKDFEKAYGITLWKKRSEYEKWKERNSRVVLGIYQGRRSHIYAEPHNRSFCNRLAEEFRGLKAAATYFGFPIPNE
ncbi:MAG TPA: hypothetical protein VHQ20_00900 [Patescibacteria group bacterium]|jgi:DNA-binding helix-hairpin-helix protein with protein kinase domain|nr:hypothetical protein [Patescibacteria group bacterium]